MFRRAFSSNVPLAAAAGLSATSMLKTTTAPSMTTSAFRFAATASEFSELQGPTPESIEPLDQLLGYYTNVQSRKMYYKDFLRIEHQAVRWAFSDIRKNSEALAHGLIQTGLRPGDRLLSIQPSNCESLVLQLACAKVGAVCCNISAQGMTADKLRYNLNLFQPTHFVGREWIPVKDIKNGEPIERNMHFWDTMYNVIPELGLCYPGQYFQWTYSTEFEFLKKCMISDHNMNLLGCQPMRRFLVWGPFSYYEQRLRMHSLLINPDDPVLVLEDPKPSMEDKAHIAYSHKHCINAGYIFGKVMGLKAEDRFGMFPNHHTDPIGAIIAPYAALTSGAVLVQLHDQHFTDDHAINVIEKLCVEEVSVLVGTKSDYDLVLKHAGNFEADQYESLKYVTIFEATSEPAASNEYLAELAKALNVQDVFVFRGTFESSYMLTSRSLKKGDMGNVPHTDAKVVGDRGVADAKVLARGTRGNLKLKGPHITPYYYNNAGLSTETVDERGWSATSREAVIDAKGGLEVMGAQVY